MNDLKLKEKLREIRAHFSEQLPQRLTAIAEELASLRAEAWPRDRVVTLHRLVHGLTGSGATFGYTAVSAAARELEAFFKAALDEQRTPAAALESELDGLWEKLQASVHLPDPSPAMPEAKQDWVDVGADRMARQILLVEDDAHLASELTAQLGYYGYEVQCYRNPADFLQGAPTEHVAAVVMDVMFPAGDLAGPVAVSEYVRRSGGEIPVVFISSRDDLEARVQAVRAGGADYFTKPVDVNELVDRLDALTQVRPSEPYRILIVEDSPQLAELYAHTLQSAGMDARVLNDPARMLVTLSDLNPDLILMDMYLPGFRGDELAHVIHQQHQYVSVPIVFLSAETDVKRQLEAMKLGGDDFLTKPIRSEHLVSSVTHRAQRYRVLRGLMESDSLTGLLNHTKIKQRLEIELARARRQQRPLSFAMLDIDHFKRVNDTYGHPVGDRVIKSLSRLLKQRLRETDIVGRYGGEEFAVILADTDGPAAVGVMDGLRQVFEEIQQQSGEDVFRVTFSGGIASFPETQTAADLNARADEALYEAKNAGRNRIVLK